MTQQFTREYLTVKDFCKQYPSITSEGSLRWIILNSKFNGADSFIRRCGKRKILINVPQFFLWLEEGGKSDK